MEMTTNSTKDLGKQVAGNDGTSSPGGPLVVQKERTHCIQLPLENHNMARKKSMERWQTRKFM